MAAAYTPGLTVSESALIRRTRRLPLKGNVLVKVGQTVAPDTPVARTLLPGVMRTVKAAEILGLEPEELPPALLIKQGDVVWAGEVIARTRSFFGLFRSECKATARGTVELISPATGHIGIREAPIAVEVNAYIRGEVVEVQPEEGVVIETRGALVQGIFGVGGERRGVLKVLVSDPSETLAEHRIGPEDTGHILVGGSQVTGAALRRASEVGAAGVIVGAIVDQELIDFLGYDIGVAITGDEKINLTLVLTEGFGSIPMAQRTFQLLRTLEGQEASINGATQIRAGVIRPEVIVPDSGVRVFRCSGVQAENDTSGFDTADPERLNAQDHRQIDHRQQQPAVPPAVPPERLTLDIGTPVRIIREPHFGMLARVTALPSEPRELPSGAVVRVLEAELEGGERVIVPRANVEAMSG